MIPIQKCANPVLSDCNWPECLCASAPVADATPGTTETIVLRAAQDLVEWATLRGVVVTIEQRPLQPLAMGHYDSVVSVRPMRGIVPA